MKKALRTLNYIVILLLCGTVLTACFDDEEVDYTTNNDLIISNVAFGTLPRIMYTTNKAGGDSTYSSTVAATSIYPFTIDQTNNVAYNLDSLPYGTRADKIVFSSFKVTDGTAAIKKLASEGDSTFSTKDTINFVNYSRGSRECFREFNLYGNDGTSRRTYRVEVRIHQQKLDSLTWTEYTADDWNSQNLNCGNVTNEFSTAGCSFRFADGVIQKLDAETAEYVADDIEPNKEHCLPTANLAWISTPSNNIKTVTQTLLYGTRTQADTLASVMWRRNIDSKGFVSSPWEFLDPTPGSIYPLPSLSSATLLPYDKGILLVGLKNDATICLKYSNDGGRTWKNHNYLVLPKNLKDKKASTLKAGIDEHSNLWLYIDAGEVWRGRAHSVDWKTERRVFED